MSEQAETNPQHDLPWEDWQVSEPFCPWCGDEITDSPLADLVVSGVLVVDCATCGEPCEVQGMTTVCFRARKAVR
jgi:hypothetical protein